MRILLLVLIVIALLVTLGILAAGVFGLFRGNDPRRSNKLMQYRVYAQFAALILMALLALLYHR